MTLAKKNIQQGTSKLASKFSDETWKGFDFAVRLRIRRDLLHFSQENLAKAIGVSNTTIQNYEAGQYPKGEHAIRLALALSCSLDWLLMGQGPMQPEEAATGPDATEKLSAQEAYIKELEARLREKDNTINALSTVVNATYGPLKPEMETQVLQFPPSSGQQAPTSASSDQSPLPSLPPSTHTKD